MYVQPLLSCLLGSLRPGDLFHGLWGKKLHQHGGADSPTAPQRWLHCQSVWKRPVVPFFSLLLRQYLVPEHILEFALAAGQEPESAFHQVGGNLEASSPACCRSAVHPGWQQTGRGPWVVSEDEYCSSG